MNELDKAVALADSEKRHETSGIGPSRKIRPQIELIRSKQATHRNIAATREAAPPKGDRNSGENRVYIDGVTDAFHCRNVDGRDCDAFEPRLREPCAHGDRSRSRNAGSTARLRTANRHD